MKLVRYLNNNQSKEKLGIELEEGIIDVNKLAEHLNFDVPHTMSQLLKDSSRSISQIENVLRRAQELNITMETYTLSFHSIKLLPIIKKPEKILCVAQNYIDHVKAGGGEVPTHPVFFSKFANTLAVHKQIIPLPPTCQKVDYEGELVIVIGKEMNGICEKDAEDGILGYSVGNDISDREHQFQSSQWLIGKSFDFFAPTSQAIVTKDEISDISNLNIRTWLNKHLVQDSSTSEMIFSVAQIVSQASQYMTLKPGDLIFTGTPSGVINEDQNPTWIKSGDNVTISIDKVGILSNQFV